MVAITGAGTSQIGTREFRCQKLGGARSLDPLDLAGRAFLAPVGVTENFFKWKSPAHMAKTSHSCVTILRAFGFACSCSTWNGLSNIRSQPLCTILSSGVWSKSEEEVMIT